MCFWMPPAEVGLDGERAREVLASDAYAAEVRQSDRWRRWRQLGDRLGAVGSSSTSANCIQGGQTVEAYERPCAATSADSKQRGPLAARRHASYSGLNPIDFSTAPTRS